MEKRKNCCLLGVPLPYLYTTLQEHIDLQGTQEGLYAVDGEEVLQLLSERMQLTPGSQQKVKANPVFLFKPKYFGSWPVFSQEKKDLLDKPKSFIFSREISSLTLYKFPESLSKRKDHDYLQGCQLLESVWFINSSYTGALPLSIRNLSISGGTYTKEGISRLVSGLDLESINLETLSKDLVRSALWAVKNKNAEASVQYRDSSGKEHRVSMNNIAVKKMISKLKKHNF